MGTSEKLGSEDFGAALESLRRRAGLTRHELAERSGLSYPYVSQLETAYRMPSSRALQALAAALGVPATQLFEALATKPDDSPKYDAGAPARDFVVGAPPPAPAVMPAAMVAPMGTRVANPRARRTANPPRPEPAAAVNAAVDALNQLPAEQRLDALSDVQRRVVESVVTDTHQG